jgi:hypothetical protein
MAEGGVNGKARFAAWSATGGEPARPARAGRPGGRPRPRTRGARRDRALSALTRKPDCPIPDSRYRTCQSNRTETTFEQPGSSMVTPYIASAVSIVRLL